MLLEPIAFDKVESKFLNDLNLHKNYVFCVIYVGEQQLSKLQHRRDRIVVSTLRCGRNNPGSNPGHGTF